MQQIKTWYYNHGRNTTSKPKFKNPRKVTIGQVIGRNRKAEVSALASQMAGGAPAGTQAYFAKYALALKAIKDEMDEKELAAMEEERRVWEEQGLPDDVKISNGLKYSKQAMYASALASFNELGLRLLAWEYHLDKNGIALYHL